MFSSSERSRWPSGSTQWWWTPWKALWVRKRLEAGPSRTGIKCFASVLTFKTNVTFMCLPRRKRPHSESPCCPSVTPDLRRGPELGMTRCLIPDALDFLICFCFTVFSSSFGPVCTDLSPLSCFCQACGCAHSSPVHTRVALLGLWATLRLSAFVRSTLLNVVWASNLCVDSNVLKWGEYGISASF